MLQKVDAWALNYYGELHHVSHGQLSGASKSHSKVIKGQKSNDQNLTFPDQTRTSLEVLHSPTIPQPLLSFLHATNQIRTGDCTEIRLHLRTSYFRPDFPSRMY